MKEPNDKPVQPTRMGTKAEKATRKRAPRPKRSPESVTDEPQAVRQKVSKAIQEVFDEQYLRSLAESVRDASRGMWAEGRCPECGSMKKVKVEVPDLAAQIRALTELVEQAEGRPGTAEGEPGGTVIIVERKWPGARSPNRSQL